MKLTKSNLTRLAKELGRHPVADAPGMFLRVIDPGTKVYWTHRFRFAGRESEPSLGPYPETGLAEALAKHAAQRASILPTPTFGEMSDLYIETHEGSWRNPKHRHQ